MAKRILLSYESLPTHFFGDSWEFNYELTLEVTYRNIFFVTKKRIEKVTHTISMFQSIRQHIDHWDKLIQTKQQIR